jgi:hypothetical protein
MEEQEVEVTDAEVLQLLQQAAIQPHGFEAHANTAGSRTLSAPVYGPIFTQLDRIHSEASVLLHMQAQQTSG